MSDTDDENADSIEFPQLLSLVKKEEKKEKGKSLPSHQAVLGKITKIWPDICKGL